MAGLSGNGRGKDIVQKKIKYKKNLNPRNFWMRSECVLESNAYRFLFLNQHDQSKSTGMYQTSKGT